MKKIKKTFIFAPLVTTVLLIIIGIAVLTVGQPNEIKIYTNSEFVRFLEKSAGDAGKKAILYSDITLDRAIEPPELACELDGNGHTVNVKDTGTSSLFAVITESGSVKNLVLCGKEGSTDVKAAAGIALRNLGTVENCIINADFSSGGFSSGICHTNNGTISGCFVRSKNSGTRNLNYVWNPICAENYGTVRDAYYADDSDGETDTSGTFIPDEEIKNGKLTEALNKYCESSHLTVRWSADENGYPVLISGNDNLSASVFSGGSAVFIACIIILVIAVPIITIVYEDRQKKKVIYNKI